MSTEPTPNNRQIGQLLNAPLARVLVQIRWPDLTAFDLDQVAAGMGARLGDSYPIVSRQSEVQMTFTPAGLREQEAGQIIRYSSADERWGVSIGRNFLALDTTEYKGHDDFNARLAVVIVALSESATIPLTIRIGYRYTNRVTGVEDLAALTTRFKPSVLGGLGAAPSDRQLVHSITESVFRVDDSFLLVRSAKVGPNESIDPSLPSVNEDSWILDLDAYDERRETFDATKVVDRCASLARIAFEHFQGVVTNEFYSRYK